MRILFLAPLAYVGSMSFAVETVRGFANRGHSVDVVCPAQADPPLDCCGNAVTHLAYSRPKLRGGSEPVFLLKAIRQARHSRYDLIIGLSQIGLIAGYVASLFTGAPLMFLSDEIWFGREREGRWAQGIGMLLKGLERRAARAATWVVTQDRNRGRLLTLVDGVDRSVLRYLPNSRSGTARSMESDFLHRSLGIDPSRRIVLWMGAVEPGDMAFELAEAAQDWREETVLVFHFRSARQSDYAMALKRYTCSGAVVVSTKPLHYDQVDLVAASASVGLALYADHGPNTRYIGRSSGKLNAFLRLGIPCIVRDFPGLRWVERSGAGIVVDSADAVGRGVRRILSSHSAYRQAATQAFDEQLSIDREFRALASEVEATLAVGPRHKEFACSLLSAGTGRIEHRKDCEP